MPRGGSKAEAAGRFKIGEASVYRWLKSGGVAYTRWSLADLTSWTGNTCAVMWTLMLIGHKRSGHAISRPRGSNAEGPYASSRIRPPSGGRLQGLMNPAAGVADWTVETGGWCLTYSCLSTASGG